MTLIKLSIWSKVCSWFPQEVVPQGMLGILKGLNGLGNACVGYRGEVRCFMGVAYADGGSSCSRDCGMLVGSVGMEVHNVIGIKE